METISQPIPGTPEKLDDGESFATLLARWARVLGGETAVTYLDHRAAADGRAVTLTWRALDERVDAVAARLADIAAPGERAAVLAGQSADYVVAFLGALRAGLVAVPLFAPGLPGHEGRLAGALADCTPRVVLTTAADFDAVRQFLIRPKAGGRGAAADPRDATVSAVAAVGSGTNDTVTAGPEVVAVDAVPEAEAREWPRPDPDAVAYLQYTSGSTRSPAGVVLTHRNVLANARQACAAYGVESRTTSTVSWLPLFHDMGLILGIGAPMVGGMAAVLMDPLAFLERPARWLQALSASPGAISAAPNFAYAYSASRVTEAEKDFLELSRVVSLINGSEPVLPATIAKFQDAFGGCGLRPEVHRSSYGLAEATVLVSVTGSGKEPRQVTFDRDRLAAGFAVPAASGTTLVSCGRPAGQRVRIADPVTGNAAEPGEVGEIRVSGPNVGRGYWGRPDASAAIFGLPPLDPDTGAGWLATGDLGVLFDGELFVTGRLKDLVVVDGRNHYPQDIEQTVEAHPAVRPHSAAAFAIDVPDGEAAVVVLERAKDAEADVADAVADLRAAVSAGHGLRLHDVVFLAPGEVPRTSSGKISRARCRASYADGSLAERRLA